MITAVKQIDTKLIEVLEMLTKNYWTSEKLCSHFKHKIVYSIYGAVDNPKDICIESEDCCEVFVSAEDYN